MSRFLSGISDPILAPDVEQQQKIKELSDLKEYGIVVAPRTRRQGVPFDPLDRKTRMSFLYNFLADRGRTYHHFSPTSQKWIIDHVVAADMTAREKRFNATWWEDAEKERQREREEKEKQRLEKERQTQLERQAARAAKRASQAPPVAAPPQEDDPPPPPPDDDAPPPPPPDSPPAAEPEDDDSSDDEKGQIGRAHV